MPAPRDEWHFDTARIGRRVLVFDEVDSTNSVTAGYGSDPAHDGLVVVAGHQTAGRGQYGRVWQSRPGASVLMSVLVFPPPDLRRPAALTAWAALSAGDAVYDLTRVQARIKWPNDLLVRGKKVCGILIEQAAGTDGTLRTVAGIGLNLNQTADDFAAAGLPDATSLGLLTGRPLDVREAVGTVVRALDFEYGRLLAGEREAVEADWKWRVGLLGRPVVVERTDGTAVAGWLRDMAFDRVELETADGRAAIPPETVARIRPHQPPESHAL